MKTISAKRLEAAGACSDQVRLFRDTFGDKLVKINAENWAKAGEVGLDRLWLTRFLKGAALAECERAREAVWAEYDRACDAARVEYERACDAAWAEYDRVRGPALAEYERVCGPARAEYERVRGAARAGYWRVCDAALFEALTKG